MGHIIVDLHKLIAKYNFEKSVVISDIETIL